MEKIFYIFLTLVGIVVLFFAIRFYLRKKKETAMVIDADRMIEDKEE